MSFHFLRPFFFLAVPAVLLVWWLARRARDPLRGWREVMDPTLLDAMVMDGGTANRWRGTGTLAAWLLTVFALAGPTWKPEPSPFADDPSPVMILLKADASMNREDLAPNRMERARLKVVDFARVRRGRPLGLIAYAGSAHLVLPPTRDTEVVANMASHIRPDIMPSEGDNLAEAIQLAEQTMEEGSILIIADTLPDYTSRLPVQFLAVAPSSPIKHTVLITADDSDIKTLDRATSGSLVSSAADGETRWAEAAYGLLPLLAVFALLAFRRDS